MVIRPCEYVSTYVCCRVYVDFSSRIICSLNAPHMNTVRIPRIAAQQRDAHE